MSDKRKALIIYTLLALFVILLMSPGFIALYKGWLQLTIDAINWEPTNGSF